MYTGRNEKTLSSQSWLLITNGADLLVIFTIIKVIKILSLHTPLSPSPDWGCETDRSVYQHLPLSANWCRFMPTLELLLSPQHQTVPLQYYLLTSVINTSLGSHLSSYSLDWKCQIYLFYELLRKIFMTMTLILICCSQSFFHIYIHYTMDFYSTM